MEPDHCTPSTSTDGATGPPSIKEEPNDDGSQSEVQLSYQQHLADNTYCKVEDYEHDIPIINIAPIVTSGSCISRPDEDYLTFKSEPEVSHTSTETSNETALKSDVVTDITEKLYEKLYEVKNEFPCPIHTAVKSEVDTDMLPKLYKVKNEFPCSTHTKIVHNDIDAGSELVEVPGELDCKPEIINNVTNIGVLGDVNIQTSVQHNDTVNHKTLLTSMNNCEVDSKDTTALGK